MPVNKDTSGSAPAARASTSASLDRQSSSTSADATQAGDAFAADGFSLPDLEASSDGDAPPPYGELPDQVQFSQSGMQADANVTDDGRVNININLKSNRIAELLAPTLRNQLTGEQKAPEAPLPPPYIPPGLGEEPGQPPPPPMNIVIQIVGSRGDVQPFVALGKILLKYGHRVRLATHATFQQFVEDAGLEFFNIGGDPAELMAFMVKHPGLMPGFDAIKSGEITKRRRGIQEILLGCWRSCIEAGDGLGPPPKQHPRDQPLEASDHFSGGGPGGPEQKPFVADAIIANPPSFAHIHIAEKMGIPLHMMFTMPWSPTRAFPHPLANIQSTNTDAVLTSYMSYALVEMMTWQGLGDVINKFRTKALDLDPMSLIWAPGLLTRLQVPYTYCWSPALISKPNDWGNNIDIAGFYFLNLASSFTPDPDLAAFLEAGPPPVYIGFGSIVVDDPDALTSMIFEAVRETGVRALVSKGWGGLGADSMGLPENVFMLGNVPHDWLFKHVSAVCHHGGAGTSAAGIQAGKPTIVVPFFGDQPFWGAMIKRAGAGPGPIPYKELTSDKLADAIRHCMEPDTQTRAQELGAKIREEQGDVEGGKSFHRHLGVDDMRCSIAPSRAAAWRVRRTKVRLSPLAAAVLVKKGQLKYTDLKLYRAKEYNTEEQPWDPISAVTCSLVADISSIAMGIADFPRELFKNRSKSSQGAASPVPSTQDNTSRQSLTAGDSASTDEKTEVQAQADDSTSTRTQTLSPRSSVVSGPTSSSQRQTDVARGGSNPSGHESTTSLGTERESRSKESQQQRDASPGGGFMTEATIERAMAAGESVGKIVETGVKSPMNFCLGLARGFRNVPRLYNDDTVRPVEKVTDLPSGIKVASKEFAFGLFDGVSGLATQPLKGAEKEGAVGLMKGFGKGIGGLLTKPASGFWAIPAYTMQGAHAQIRNMFASSVQNYIIASRVKQGENDLADSTLEEQKDVVLRWNKIKVDLHKWQAMKTREQNDQQRRERVEREVRATSGDGAEAAAESSSTQSSSQPGPSAPSSPPPKTGFFRTMNMSFDERKALHARKDAWKKQQQQQQQQEQQEQQQSRPQQQIDVKTPPALPARTPSSESRLRPDNSSLNSRQEDEEFERAIQASVAATSQGDVEEDARVEEAIRASVNQVRSSGRGLPGTKGTKGAGLDAIAADDEGEGDDPLQITDEEYQELIEKAIQQSLSLKAAGVDTSWAVSPDDDDEELQRALEQSKTPVTRGYESEEDEEMRQAIEASTKAQEDKTAAGGHGQAEDDDEQLRKAIDASMSEQNDREKKEQAAKTEEEIVMEFVKKQSLAEEEYRRQVAKGKTKAGGAGGDGDEDNDEDLKRAMTESLKVEGDGGRGEGSGSTSGQHEQEPEERQAQ